jgi:hypothetical protein
MGNAEESTIAITTIAKTTRNRVILLEVVPIIAATRAFFCIDVVFVALET